jgi:hypothetical protein
MTADSSLLARSEDDRGTTAMTSAAAMLAAK